MTPLAQLLGVTAVVTALLAIPIAVPLVFLGAAWVVVLLPALLG